MHRIFKRIKVCVYAFDYVMHVSGNLTDFVEGFPELFQVISGNLCDMVLHFGCSSVPLE